MKKIKILFLILFLVLVFGYLWQQTKGFNFAEIKKGENFISKFILSLKFFFEEKKNQFPQEFKKEVGEMREDLVRLWGIFWQKFGKKITVIAGKLWQKAEGFFEKLWKIILPEIKKIFK